MRYKAELSRKEKFVTHKRIKNGKITFLKVDGFVKSKIDVMNDLLNCEYFIFINGKKTKKILKCGDYMSVNVDDLKDDLNNLPTF
jgi:hypothetical protein